MPTKIPLIPETMPEKLIYLGDLMGISLDPDGSCYGECCMSLQAGFSNQGLDQFQGRLKQIHEFMNSIIIEFKEQFDDMTPESDRCKFLKENVLAYLNKQSKEYLRELDTFLRSIKIHQDPDAREFKNLWPKRILQQDAELTFDLLEPAELKITGNTILKVGKSRSAVFDMDILKSYLSLIDKHVQNLSAEKQLIGNLGMLLSDGDHTISLIYCPQGEKDNPNNKYYLYNPRTWIVENHDVDDVSNTVLTIFSNENEISSDEGEENDEDEFEDVLGDDNCAPTLLRIDTFTTKFNLALYDSCFTALESNEDWLDVFRVTSDKIDVKDKTGSNWLHFAIECDEEKIIDELLARKIDINLKAEDTFSPLAIAVQNRKHHYSKKLIDAGADLNLTYSDNDETILHMAISDKNIDSFRILLCSPNIDINKPNKFGKSPLHYAVQKNNALDYVKELLQHQANPNQFDLQNVTPLHLAAKLGKEEIVKLFLEYNSQHNIDNHSVKSVMELAAKNGEVAVINLLQQVLNDMQAKSKVAPLKIFDTKRKFDSEEGNENTKKSKLEGF